MLRGTRLPQGLVASVVAQGTGQEPEGLSGLALVEHEVMDSHRMVATLLGRRSHLTTSVVGRYGEPDTCRAGFRTPCR